MSESDDHNVQVAGESDASDPIDALRDALSDALGALLAAGRGPHHLRAMRWETAEPALFHPARHEIGLIYREVFGGFGPPVTLACIGRRGVRAVAVARALAAPEKTTYRGYAPPDLARQYSPRAQADMNALFKQWSTAGERFFAANGGIELAYGPSRFETFDLFRPKGVERPPVWVFIHGGYWQASDKRQHAQFAKGMLASGYAVVMPNYGLAPEAPLAEMVTQMARLTAFLVKEGANLCLDTAKLHLAGHSAGAHLAAMVARENTSSVGSVLLLSGLFDLEPLTLLPVGRLLELTPSRAAALSPALLAPPVSPRIGLAVGEGETDEFKRQSCQLAAAWQAPDTLIVSGNHFTMLDGLHEGPLLALARSLAEA